MTDESKWPVLLAAADLIEKKGWTRGKFCRDGRRCLLGAVVEAGIIYPSVRPLGLTHMLHFLGVDSLTEWNDAQRSRVPVLKALREAAYQGEPNDY